jgi:hypothetical protein
VASGMRADFSWDRSAQSYLELYRAVIERRISEERKKKGPKSIAKTTVLKGRSLNDAP